MAPGRILTDRYSVMCRPVVPFATNGEGIPSCGRTIIPAGVLPHTAGAKKMAPPEQHRSGMGGGAAKGGLKK